jgi:hypothetical protein
MRQLSHPHPSVSTTPAAGHRLAGLVAVTAVTLAAALAVVMISVEGTSNSPGLAVPQPSGVAAASGSTTASPAWRYGTESSHVSTTAGATMASPAWRYDAERNRVSVASGSTTASPAWRYDPAPRQASEASGSTTASPAWRYDPAK